MFSPGARYPRKQLLGLLQGMLIEEKYASRGKVQEHVVPDWFQGMVLEFQGLIPWMVVPTENSKDD